MIVVLIEAKSLGGKSRLDLTTTVEMDRQREREAYPLHSTYLQALYTLPLVRAAAAI